MIQANRPMCKESRVVQRSPENTTCVILAKIGSYPPQKRLQYIIDANKLILAKANDFCTTEDVCK